MKLSTIRCTGNGLEFTCYSYALYSRLLFRKGQLIQVSKSRIRWAWWNRTHFRVNKKVFFYHSIELCNLKQSYARRYKDTHGGTRLISYNFVELYVNSRKNKNSRESFWTISLVKREFVVTHTILQIGASTLINSWVYKHLPSERCVYRLLHILILL